jgi:hypothetical protein
MPTRFTTESVIIMFAKAARITAKAGMEFFMYIFIRVPDIAMNIIAERIGFIVKRNFPKKNPRIMFSVTVQNFAFLPLEKIRNTTADIQKKARVIAIISCL